MLKGLYLIVYSCLFGETFKASWFISSCILAAVIIVVASRYLRNWQIVFAASVPYVAGCLLTNYAEAPFVGVRLYTLKLMFIDSNTFWAALLWFALGKLLADTREALDSVSTRRLIIASAIGFAALCFEHYWVTANAWNHYRDWFFSLPFVCVPLFLLVLRARVSIPFARELRAASTVTYCLHFTLFFGLKACLAWLGITLSEPVRLLVLLALCWSATAAILRLERLPHLRWLRYAH